MSGVLGSLLGSPRGYSAQSQQFLSRIVDPGVIRCNLYAAMIDGFVNDGNWASITGLWMHAADVIATAKINLKSSSYTCIQTGTLTFTANHCFTGNGSTGYLDTGIDNKGGISQNNNSFGYYCLTARTAYVTMIAMGADDGTGPRDYGPRYTTNYSQIVDEGGLSYYTGGSRHGTSDPSGMHIVSVTGATTGAIYRNGNTTAAHALAGTTVAVTTAHNIYLFARSADPGPGADTFTTDQHAAHFVGTGLTATQASKIAARINTYLTALSVNAY